MQLSIRFIVCSFGIASTATTAAATFASEMTKLLFVALTSAAGLATGCAAHCCSPSIGWSSAGGSRLRFQSRAEGPAATATFLKASSAEPDIAAAIATADCLAAKEPDWPSATKKTGSFS